MDLIKNEPPFAEIVIGGGAAHSPQALPVQKPLSDAAREKFMLMRKIARDHASPRYDHVKVYFDRERRIGISRIFYKQAVFMRDFEDDFPKQVPFHAYFPYYQLMSYEQLRSYFTWRTRVRMNDVTDAALSYAFLYLYELINQIGIRDPQDGLDRLLAFWQAYRVFNGAIDKYTAGWIKDYHVYYSLPKPFKDFIDDNRLHAHFPEEYTREPEPGDFFERGLRLSKYDLTKSAFYSEETRPLIAGCFNAVIDRVRRLFASADLNLDDMLNRVDPKKAAWYPFDEALFYPVLEQPDRRVYLSPGEIYQCRQNQWIRTADTDGNRHLAGYIMKQTESSLRQVTRFKHKLTVSVNMLDETTLNLLYALGLDLEKEIQGAVSDYYTEINKTVVTVDAAMLERIRREATDIQEKLIVRDEADSPPDPRGTKTKHTAEPEPPAPPNPPALPKPDTDIWAVFARSLSQTEARALAIILNAGNLKAFSVENGFMPEVLIDGINQKAWDCLGDNVLDYGDQAEIYAEYVQPIQNITDMVDI